jgi:hypothetical protein
MRQGISLFVYPVKDLARAKTLYRTLLGVEPYTDTAYYVGFGLEIRKLGWIPTARTRA